MSEIQFDLKTDEHMDTTIEQLREMLQTGVVRFTYKKINGEQRYATGTTMLSIIDNYNGPKPKGLKPQNQEVLNYFDLDSEGWRACRIDNIVNVMRHTPIKEEQGELKFD